MAFINRKFAAHLGEAAKRSLSACRRYPPAHILSNPLTRPVAIEIAHREWRATLSQIDFEYRIEQIAIGNVPCTRYSTRRTSSSNPLILYLHAGAFVAGSPTINAAAILPACELSGSEAIGVDYTLAPHASYPSQIEEIERVYRALLANGHAPNRIVLAGDSAGGTLALACLARWRRLGLPAPAGAVLMAAMTDCTGGSDTHITLARHDPIFGGGALNGLRAVMRLYAPGENLRAPEISPVYADYKKAPPLLIQVGSRDVLLGDSARLAERARQAGAEATLRVFDGMFHLFHMHWSLPEARAAFEDMAGFITRVTARRSALSAA